MQIFQFMYAFQRNVLVFSWFSVCNKYSDRQTDDHRYGKDPVYRCDLSYCDIPAPGRIHIVINVVTDDGHEDQAESHGNCNIRRLMTESDGTSHAASVQFHLIHHR